MDRSLGPLKPPFVTPDGYYLENAARNALRWQVDSHVTPKSAPLNAASSV